MRMRRHPATPVVHRMARREAAVLLGHPTLQPWTTTSAVRVSVRTVGCPWCRGQCRSPVGLVPMAGIRLLPEGEPAAAGSAELLALPCEWMTARPLLPLAFPEEGPPAPAVLMTRAAAAAQLLSGRQTARWEYVLDELDARESWVDCTLTPPAHPLQSASPPGTPVLPASGRLAPGDPAASAQRTMSGEHAGSVPHLPGPHLLTPHLVDPELTWLNGEYQKVRRSVVAAGIGGTPQPTKDSLMRRQRHKSRV